MLMMFALIFIFLFFCVILLILDSRQNYGILEECGIPVAKPSLFLGSDPNFHKCVRHLVDLQRFKKFGPVWGAYVGRTPQIFIADPELIRQILVNDFEYFSNRSDIQLGSPLLTEIIGYLKDEKWRKLRSLFGPLLTPCRLKEAAEIISDCAFELVNNLKEKCFLGRVAADCRRTLIPCLVDMTSRAVLGIQMKNGKSMENKFVSAFTQFMGEHTEYNWLYTWTLSFPFLTKFSPTHLHESIQFVQNTFRHILENISNLKKEETGKESNRKMADVIVNLWKNANSNEFKKFGFNQETIIAEVIDVFIGGYEAPAAALSHLFYYLAQNPEIQEKLQAEVDPLFGDEEKAGRINADCLKDEEVPYTKACVKEALRLCPVIFGPQRVCTKDWAHGPLRIKKGMSVIVATWAGNRNPDIFPSPEQFIPERFLGEGIEGGLKTNAYAFSTFGHGPRKCIGTKFSYESMKIFLVYIIRNFRIQMTKDTELKYKTGSRMLVNFEPLILDFVQRNHQQKICDNQERLRKRRIG